MSENIFEGVFKVLNPLVANFEGVNSKNLGRQNLPFTGGADQKCNAPLSLSALYQSLLTTQCNIQLIIISLLSSAGGSDEFKPEDLPLE